MKTPRTNGPLQNVPKPLGVDPAARGSEETVIVETDKSGGVLKITAMPIPAPTPAAVPELLPKKRISPVDNTLWDLQGASLLAFVGLLEDRDITFELVGDDKTPSHIVITWDRYAMDGYGHHVGYENYKATCPVFPTVLFGGRIRLPHGLDPWCLFPCMFNVEIVSYPDSMELEEDARPIDDYSPPDEDFAQQEFEVMLRNWDNDLPVATFDPCTRTWELAGREWKVSDPSVEYTYL